MSRLAELAHWLWMETQLGTPPSLQHMLVSRLHKAKEFVRFLIQPQMPLSVLGGQNEEGPLQIVYGGLGYAKPFLKSMLFAGEPTEKQAGKMFTWRAQSPIGRLTSDLTIIESTHHLIRRLPGEQAITLPFRVEFALDLRGDWEQVEQRLHRNVRRNVRKAQRDSSYDYEISHAPQDVESFYHTMYLPTMQERHGEQAAILPKREAYQLLKHGWLFFIKRDGIRVCGSLGYAQEGTVQFKEMGVLNGDPVIMKEGVVDVMNYLRMQWAHQNGFRTLSLGECWPYLSGNFLFKRKWGGSVSMPPHERKQIWIRIERNTPAVAHFFRSNPCVIMDDSRNLYALVVTGDSSPVTTDTAEECARLYATPGLNGIIIHSINSLINSYNKKILYNTIKNWDSART